MKDREIAVKEADVQRKIAESSARLQLDAEKAINRDEIERERIQSQEQIAGAKIGQQVASDLLEVDETRKAEAREDFQKGIDIARQIVEDVNKNE